MRHISLLVCWVVGAVGGATLPARLLAQPSPSGGPAVTNKFYSPAGKWIQVSNTNCLVWNSWPGEGESVTWTGEVLDRKAHGQGILQWFTNGTPTTRYEGSMKSGLADGHGTASGAGAEYAGEWKRGNLVSTNGTIKYDGGGWYRGELKDGFKTGCGEESMRGGVRYIGQFKDDRFDGRGEMVLTNGDRIAGEWRDSKLKGVGTYHIKGGASFKVKQTEAGIERL